MSTWKIPLVVPGSSVISFVTFLCVLFRSLKHQSHDPRWGRGSGFCAPFGTARFLFNLKLAEVGGSLEVRSSRLAQLTWSLLKIQKLAGMVARACNPSYSGG